MKADESQAKNRRSVRLPSYDYRTAGAYFVTLVTASRACLFGDVADDEVVLTPIGQAVVEEWQRMPHARPYVAIDEFIVMPNHVHGIIWLTNDSAATDEGMARHAPTVRRFGAPQAQSLAAVVGGFKAAVTKRARAVSDNSSLAVWQRGFYEHIIRNDDALQRIRRYIAENSKGWPADEENPNRRNKRATLQSL